MFDFEVCWEVRYVGSNTMMVQMRDIGEKMQEKDTMGL
jgi:hypothetical protein